MKDKIIFDFDGTIVDCAAHDYKIYCDVLHILGQPHLDFHTYWSYRQSAIPINDLLAYSVSEDVTESYLELRAQFFNDASYESLLTLLPGAREAIEYCFGVFECYLVTARSDISTATKKCKEFGIWERFAHARAGEKCEIFDSIKPIALSVSDTEKDIDVARKAGVHTIVSITTGIRSRQILMNAHPTYVIDNLSELPEIIKYVQQKSVI